MRCTYRYPLRPTRAQAETLTRWLGVCCDLYNAALQERRDAWQKARKSVGLYDQQIQLTEVRAADAGLASMPAWVQRSALRRVDFAFRAFFRRARAGQTPGYPRFKSRRCYDSFSFPARKEWSIRGNTVPLPHLGAVRFIRCREITGTPKDIRIGRDCDGWYVSIACADVPCRPLPATGRSIGIDVGVANLVTTSDGEVLGSIAGFKAADRRLRSAQRRVTRRARGSNRRRKAVAILARLSAHLSRCIKYQLDVISKRLIAENDVICVEDLRIANMARGTNRRRSGLRRSIHLASWARLRHMLTYKAESAGRQLSAVPPRGTSQECSRCGQVVPKNLTERMHVCDCGLAIGRDHNAAVNVLQRGVLLLRRGDGVVMPLRRPEKVAA